MFMITALLLIFGTYKVLLHSISSQVGNIPIDSISDYYTYSIRKSSTISIYFLIAYMTYSFIFGFAITEMFIISFSFLFSWCICFSFILHNNKNITTGIVIYDIIFRIYVIIAYICNIFYFGSLMMKGYIV